MNKDHQLFGTVQLFAFPLNMEAGGWLQSMIYLILSLGIYAIWRRIYRATDIAESRVESP